jgi:hypothetical protein
VSTENHPSITVDQVWVGATDQGPAPGGDVATGDADEFDCTPPTDIPEGWAELLEQQFAGKAYGLIGFGPEFKMALLVQIANANNALELEVDAAKAEGNVVSLEQINELIDTYSTFDCPSEVHSYVRPIIIAVAREDIGRAYLKALQRQGQMMGANYKSLAQTLADAIAYELPEEDSVLEPDLDPLSADMDAAAPVLVAEAIAQ